MKNLTPLVLISLLLTACGGPKEEAAMIEFIGISSGTLTTDLDNLEFKESFELDERNLVAVVAFKKVNDETNVQATWFSPDDRRMPLGRKSIVTESGATIARFSLASQEDWQKAPFMLDIRAMVGEGETMKTASGQLHFYMGMNEDEVESYNQEYAAWTESEINKREMYAAKRRKEEGVRNSLRASILTPEADIAFRYNLTGDEEEELVIIDPNPEEPFMGSTETGAVFSADIDTFAIADINGKTIISFKEGIVHGVQGPLGASIDSKDMVKLIVFEDSVELRWEEGDQACSQRFTLSDEWVGEEEKVCE
ncbi:hypothetical protein KJ652_02215 [Patescibacteria group bacterium]|nr:hypothetical protein [Patescibacteria group bacterium]MBU1123380.1 hypothetical protein [Patescibacteria group bacterium]MBU1911000.1 hypothetical protein [Patescibacteria group bacterium]